MTESRGRGAQPAEFRLVLSPTSRAGSRARTAIRQRFSGALSSETLSDLVMVVTELVNNAVEHGPGRPITVAVVLGNESIRGEVADQGNPAAAIPRILDAGESERLGLDVVDKLTAEWAVYEGSTHVWFELPLDR